MAKPDGNADVSLAKGNPRIFVGNLAWSATEDDLYELFGSCGEVSHVRIATSQEDGRPRGFAHVEFTDVQGAANAISTLHDTEFCGRNLRVDSCEPRQNRTPNGASNGWANGSNGTTHRGGGGRDGEAQPATVFIKFFHSEADEDTIKQDIQDTFADCGTVEDIRLPSADGVLKGFGYIKFDSDEAK